VIGHTSSSEPVLIVSGDARLAGVLELPGRARGVVLCPQRPDPRRILPRVSYLAEQLRRAGLATLQIDLLDADESAEGAAPSELALLGARLSSAADWLATEPETNKLALGLFGSGENAAAVLQLAACRPQQIAAVVARGGRPDLAGAELLARVRAPTLLIVGEQDHPIIEQNRRALDQLGGEKDLAVIRGATYPREAQRTLPEVARLAARWFKGYFGGDTRPASPHTAPGLS
jgi:putative phosphoribosyl transferase